MSSTGSPLAIATRRVDSGPQKWDAYSVPNEPRLTRRGSRPGRAPRGRGLPQRFRRARGPCPPDPPHACGVEYVAIHPWRGYKASRAERLHRVVSSRSTHQRRVLRAGGTRQALGLTPPASTSSRGLLGHLDFNNTIIYSYVLNHWRAALSCRRTTFESLDAKAAARCRDEPTSTGPLQPSDRPTALQQLASQEFRGRTGFG